MSTILNQLKEYEELERSIEKLFLKRCIHLDVRDELLKKLKESVKAQGVFITEPFRTCPSMGRTLYDLLVSRRNAYLKNLRSMAHEDQSA